MSSVDFNDLGARVRELRRANHLTQAELSEMCGVTPSFLGHIERGTRVASVETLVHLCNALKVSPQYLLSASLEPLDPQLMPENREKLSKFFYMAQEFLDNWDTWHE